MSAGFDATFATLRAIMLKHAKGLAITRDEPGDLVVRTPQLDAKGQPGWFGTVTIKKSYVAYHLIPLYDRPELAAALPAELERRRQGKTCFNFRTVSPELVRQLDTLTAQVRASGDRGA